VAASSLGEVIAIAVLALTATPDILGQLRDNESIQVAVVINTASDNGDGTWSVTALTGEEQIPAIQALGCTVETLVTDAEELADFETVDSQIDDSPPVA
jgi:hypothetical protein